MKGNYEFAVETNGLVKEFHGFKAVKGIDIKVPKGSVYGFLGPNGAGKTTTLKMLTGLSKPTGGTIRICGREVVFGRNDSNLNIGFLPDVPNYYDWMKPSEFLTFTGELFGMDKEVLKKRIPELLELVGLAGINKKVGGFSRGMKQRLGIAQALINNPEVVFLDEPTSALDPIGRKEVIDIIQTLAGRTTVFFSTHILADIERVCDRVVILDKGAIVLEDSMAGLRDKYGVHAIEMETYSSGTKVLKAALQKTGWVERVEEKDAGEVLAIVRDMKKAYAEIPAIFKDNGLPLVKFHAVEPSLEDIFLKAVNQQ